MKFDKTYPFNLIDDLMLGEEFYSELEDDEIIQEVESIIQSLNGIYVVNKHIPKKMQMIIKLYYEENLTYNDIGGIMGISSSRVGQIRQRTLRLLRHPSRINKILLRNFQYVSEMNKLIDKE